ncbi:hypothetical protein Avbf_00210 [Armadillidium vulgare]|nr:hypothetical protein Avbf_00210 [Armadillidium vulgare]
MFRDRLRRKSLQYEKGYLEVPKTRSERRGSLTDRLTLSTTVSPSPPPKEAPSERRGSLVVRWLRHLHDAQASYNAREGRNRRPHPTPHIPDSEESAPSTDLRDVEDGVDADNSESVEGGNEGSLSRSKQENMDGGSFNSNSSAPQAASSPDSLAKKTESGVPPNSSSAPGGTGSPPQANPSGVAPRRRLQEVQIIQIVEGPSLIQPSEVKVSQGVVLSAEPVLTPIELLRRKDLKIRQELEEKQTLIADILNIPHQDFESVADMAGEVGLSNQEPRELVLGAIYQAKKLQEALNEAQSIRDSDIIAAQACSDSIAKTSIPFCHTSLETMEKLNNITGTITQFLNSLMVLISERDDERERMRKELVASRERLHQLHLNQQTILQEQASSSESQTQGSQSTISSSSSVIANTVVSTSIEPITPHSSRPSSFVSANSSGAEQSELTDQQTTDEEGRSEDVSSAEVQSQSWMSIERNEGESTWVKTGTKFGFSSVPSKEQQSEAAST